MATKQSEECLVQVATQVPQSLLEAVRVWCVAHGVSMMAFVTDALRDKLKRTSIHQV
jgi:hypothetical protein